MGMTGNYVAVNDQLLKQIKEGEVFIIEAEEKADEILDIDKSWQAIHYVLCKDIAEGEPPMGYVVPMRNSCFMENDDEFDLFVLNPNQVKEASEYLNALNEDALRDLFDFNALLEEEVYPFFAQEEEEETFEYIQYYISELKKFFQKAVQQESSVIFYIS